ncbi:MAG: thioester reductase domain-containing protein [Microcystis panniformis]|uniref:thioester reductase domain-containing protein n=1 Tax=Microcystis TaxID=1125 RepID=UPI000E370677|nr:MULTISPECIES: thioester reductase domain-containing protein [Microcystis]MBD2291032.1 thioester reductase domain-containing protein [Microcystis wesenbergii FACHB-1317]REJ54419.1 MAG: NAD-dependent epimerase/dehydratase family protein [Microcystis aeruginosa TA09]UZO75816.1 thioester reductase domain-containing protein [Microcystis aeruginosa str. Chao 1910]
MTKPVTQQLDLKAEVNLDSSIQFEQSLSKNVLEPKAILLTGATGFLGAYLLEELLQKTSADIYCLVRCSNIEEGKNRLQKNLEFYSLWQDDFNSRIIPIIGDLGKPLFGLSQLAFEGLAAIIDIIYHNGAWVNSARPYSTLKPVNVLGTQEVLRLASREQTKPVHFVSTLGVFLGDNQEEIGRITEMDSPNFVNLQGGYRQSKWVAEQLVMVAQKRGLPACIYRPSRIIGNSKTGINGNFQDFLCILLKGCIQLKKFPDLNTQIDIVPVDYVSQAIVGLSQQKNHAGQVFHLINSQLIFWETFFNSLQLLGYSLEKVDYDNFYAELKYQLSQSPKNKVYSSLLLLLKLSKLFSSDKLEFDATRTLIELTELSISCPVIDEKLLSLYFSYFQKVGYFPPIIAVGWVKQ